MISLLSIVKSSPSMAGFVSPSVETANVTVTLPLPGIPANTNGISKGSVAFSFTEAVVFEKLALLSSALNDCGMLSSHEAITNKVPTARIKYFNFLICFCF